MRKGQQGEIERIHPPPTNSKNRLKSFCDVGYANFRPNVFAAGKRISMDMQAWCPVALKGFVAFSKNGNVQENIYRRCNVKRLEQDIKSRCKPHFIWNAWNLKCSTVKVICTCGHCDAGFCAVQLTALTKLNWCVLPYCCACLHPNTILMEAGWTVVPCPATN